jgi:outer membrane protein assembly factor BamE (lipoprotein component of BamABCDE complex)
MKRLTKRILIGIGISILAAGLAGIVFFIIILYPVFENRFDDGTFDRELWHTYHQSMDRDNPRGNMADDLRENHLRQGMKKDEVIALLGEPDFDEQTHVFKYTLGMWSGTRIDYDSLDIEFDLSGRLVKTSIVQH